MLAETITGLLENDSLTQVTFAAPTGNAGPWQVILRRGPWWATGGPDKDLRVALEKAKVAFDKEVMRRPAIEKGAPPISEDDMLSDLLG